MELRDKAYWVLGGTFLLVLAWAQPVAAQGVQDRSERVGAGQGSSVESSVRYQESHALVIGIGEYDHWPRLSGALADVDSVTSILREHGFNVVLEIDPDKDELDEALDAFVSQYGRGPDNGLLIYFAGHGHTMPPAYGGEMGYLVPADAPDPDADPQGFRDRALAMSTIEDLAKSIQAKHALFVFDACFAGSVFTAQRSSMPRNIEYKLKEPVRQFITSGQADEPVPDQSYFRKQFVDALRGDGDTDGDNYVTGTELGEFLQRTVINYSKNTTHPQYGKLTDPNLDKGDFVFEVPAKYRLARAEIAPPNPVSPSAELLVDEAAVTGRAINARERMKRAKEAAKQQLPAIQKHAPSDYQAAVDLERKADRSYGQATPEGHRVAEVQYTQAAELFEAARTKTLTRLAATYRITETINAAFKSGIENGDMGQLDSLSQSLSPKNRRQAFKRSLQTVEMVSNENEIRRVELGWSDWQFIGDDIRAKILVEINYSDRRGENHLDQHRYTWTFRKEGGTWIIVDYTFEDRAPK